jgi:hypothetical protein
MTKAIVARGAKARTKLTPAQREEDEEGPLNRHWRTYFLQKLAETSNVTASADYAGVATSRAYKARREHAGFARAWRSALSEGYQHLEMEVLGFLRGTATERKIDVANALRLLAAHRAAVAQERAASDDCDEQEVLDSIDAMIDEMRQRTIANTALLTAPDLDDDEDDR